jgi:2,4-dienoyl-CoA reductase-like NADH-dependent reductase (Old Yellow Enzyme family)
MIHAFTTSLYVIVKTKPETVKVISEKTHENTSVLFKESKINNIQLKSRFIRSATWLGIANLDGTCTPANISWLLPVARSGVGLFISEMLYVSTDGICMPGFAGISDDRHLPGLKRMTDFVHRAGCRIVAQLNHGGLMSIPALTGNIPAGPSMLETPEGMTGREMTIEDIESVIVQFAEAAKRSVAAGFDGVQVHTAHGYLLNQFLSPFFNKRSDEYGGILENRSRLLLRVVNAVRGSIGPDKALLVKINSDDLIPGGFSTGEMIKVAVMLEDAGIDAIEISGGTASAFLMGDPENSPGPRLKKHVYYRDAAMTLRKKVSIPVILVGGIRTFEEAEDVIKSGVADYISLSRPLIREPDLISKWRSGNMKTSECISEGACLFEGLQGRGVHCIHVHTS